jgi:hypothetical protein
VIFTNDADAARSRLAAAKEKISFHYAPVAMPQSQRTFAFDKRVAAIRVLARLAGDDFGIAVALIKVIVFDSRS